MVQHKGGWGCRGNWTLEMMRARSQDCHNSAAALQTLPDTTQQQLFKTFLTGYKGEELGVQC